MDYERFLLENLGTVERVVAYVARRHRLSRDEADELSSAVKLKLVDHDYEVLRKYEGRSSLRTYLTAVVIRLFLDDRVARWGKWRPSAQAKRLGAVAVLLDRLLTRDGLSRDEAIEVLRTNHGITASPQELQQIAAQLPTRTPAASSRKTPSSTRRPPSTLPMRCWLEDREVHEAERIELALAAALDKLAPEERLVLKLHFTDGHQVSTISRLLTLDQRALYRRIERVKQVLRAELEARGVTWEAVTAILGHPAVSLAPVVRTAAGENPPARPSFG